MDRKSLFATTRKKYKDKNDKIGANEMPVKSSDRKKNLQMMETEDEGQIIGQ